MLPQLVISKTGQFFPTEEKQARFQASLFFPFGQETMAAQPSNGFLHHTIGALIKDREYSCHHGFRDAL